MDSVIVDENIKNGAWPDPLRDSWAYSFYHNITGDTVISIFFDQDFPEGTIIEGYNIPYQIPDAYISWMPDGTCREVYVKREFRRKGIGTALCALARTYLYQKNGIVFHAPPKMTELAQSMYENVCNVYNENYTESLNMPPLMPYGYWGGYLMD